jgi:arylsulfatase A-like enzyme
MNHFLRLIVLVTLLCRPSLAAEPTKPNIVFIMADDLGWRDIGCFGSTFHRTPHLDELAVRGVKFTQAYASNPLCSPTRSSVLTGLYPARTGITSPTCHLPQVILEKRLASGNPQTPVLVAESVTRLSTDYTTLPEILRAAGYATGHFGKWHLGQAPYSPREHGFDVDFPAWSGPGPAGSYVAPWAATFPQKGTPGEHIEDTTAAAAAQFIREHKDEPFFLNYWLWSVHSPYDAKDELVAKYRGRVDPQNPQRNPVYAAMIESLDDAVGRVLAPLEENGLLEKTVIVFFSDNGGVSWTGNRGAAKHKSDRFQADMKSPPTSNLPLRNGKASLYEGGVREPCIIVWPGVTQPGSSNDTLIQSIDWMPTLLEIANVPLPANAKPDGLSLVPVLKGEKLNRDTLFCHFPHDVPASGQHPGASVRRGDWKLIRLFAQNDDGTDQFELYDLNTDLGEKMNRAAEKPDLVRELNALLDGFLKDTQAVIPKRNPDFKVSRFAR